MEIVALKQITIIIVGQVTRQSAKHQLLPTLGFQTSHFRG